MKFWKWLEKWIRKIIAGIEEILRPLSEPVRDRREQHAEHSEHKHKKHK